MFEIYAYYWFDETVKDITYSILCQHSNNGSDCRSFLNDVRLAVLHCTYTICYTTFAFLLMVYSLFPGPARMLWVGYYRTLCRCTHRTVQRSKSQHEINGRSGNKLVTKNLRIGVNNKAQLEQTLNRKASTATKIKTENFPSGRNEIEEAATESSKSCSIYLNSADTNNNPKRVHTKNFQENCKVFGVTKEGQVDIDNACNKRTKKFKVRRLLRRVFSVNKLRKAADPESERLVRSVEATNRLERAKSAREYFWSSRFTKPKMRWAIWAV